MALTSTGSIVGPGQRITVEVAGSISVWRTDAVFREALLQQILMQGFTPETVEINSGYGVSTKSYTARIVLSPLAQVKLATIIAGVARAAEGAGSYTPTVTVPAIGQAVQLPIASDGFVDAVVGTATQVVKGAGHAVEGAGKTINALPSVATLLIIGVVILGVFVVAPNAKEFAKVLR